MQSIQARAINVVNGMTLITDPTLIKIMVIKPKYVDQIKNILLQHEETFFDRDIRYLGKVRGGAHFDEGVIIFYEVGKDYLQKIDYAFFAQIWKEEKGVDSFRTDYKPAFKSIPQLFSD